MLENRNSRLDRPDVTSGLCNLGNALCLVNKSHFYPICHLQFTKQKGLTSDKQWGIEAEKKY